MKNTLLLVYSTNNVTVAIVITPSLLSDINLVDITIKINFELHLELK